MKKSRLAQLRQQGFDESRYEGNRRWRPKCSQCHVLVINGHPTHEHGCPNAPRHENPVSGIAVVTGIGGTALTGFMLYKAYAAYQESQKNADEAAKMTAGQPSQVATAAASSLVSTASTNRNTALTYCALALVTGTLTYYGVKDSQKKAG